MPKMKSKKGAVKRFRVRGSGSIKRHILTKKSTKRKRQMRRRSAVDQTNTRAIRSMLPYSS
jgi:large subunit ribosomal protein L35